jgi:hypothetical protein
LKFNQYIYNMKSIQHTSFVNLYNKDNKIFDKIFNKVDKLSSLSNNIIKLSKSFGELSYQDADKLKGDLFEIFAECFFKVLPVSPSKNGGYGIYDYKPAPPNSDYGVDGFGIGMDEKPLTVQVKFRSNQTDLLTQDDIKQFAFQSILKYGVDKDTKTNMIVFTNTKGLHWITESRVFDGKLRPFGSDEISGLIDNNTVFWKLVKDLINQTISERYKK